MRNLAEGLWFNIRDEADFMTVGRHGSRSEKSYRADVRLGEFCGPGWYLLVSYANRSQRHGLETFHEMLPAEAVVSECRSQISDLAYILKSARKKQGAS